MNARQLFGIHVIGGIGLLLLFSACEDRSAKFHAGDKVRVKFTQAEGVISLRTRFFREHLYHITVAGTVREHYPIGENEEYAANLKKWGEADSYKPWHDEGPYYESELEPVR